MVSRVSRHFHQTRILQSVNNIPILLGRRNNRIEQDPVRWNVSKAFQTLSIISIPFRQGFNQRHVPPVTPILTTGPILAKLFRVQVAVVGTIHEKHQPALPAL
uniref:(northern house mosquito) hypothetical protein n=1 Tax=Culex pipiens TaxID=7175 RepID=A0A8D8KTW9_CULPI